MSEEQPIKKHAEQIAVDAYTTYRNAMGGKPPPWDKIPYKEKVAWVLSTRAGILSAKKLGVPQADGVNVPDVHDDPAAKAKAEAEAKAKKAKAEAEAKAKAEADARVQRNG